MDRAVVSLLGHIFIGRLHMTGDDLTWADLTIN